MYLVYPDKVGKEMEKTGRYDEISRAFVRLCQTPNPKFHPSSSARPLGKEFFYSHESLDGLRSSVRGYVILEGGKLHPLFFLDSDWETAVPALFSIGKDRIEAESIIIIHHLHEQYHSHNGIPQLSQSEDFYFRVLTPGEERRAKRVYARFKEEIEAIQNLENKPVKIRKEMIECSEEFRKKMERTGRFREILKAISKLQLSILPTCGAGFTSPRPQPLILYSYIDGGYERGEKAYVILKKGKPFPLFRPGEELGIPVPVFFRVGKYHLEPGSILLLHNFTRGIKEDYVSERFNFQVLNPRYAEMARTTYEAFEREIKKNSTYAERIKALKMDGTIEFPEIAKACFELQETPDTRYTFGENQRPVIPDTETFYVHEDPNDEVLMESRKGYVLLEDGRLHPLFFLDVGREFSVPVLFAIGKDRIEAGSVIIFHDLSKERDASGCIHSKEYFSFRVLTPEEEEKAQQVYSYFEEEVKRDSILEGKPIKVR